MSWKYNFIRLAVLSSILIGAVPGFSWACPDINGLLDKNCNQELLIVAFGDSITAGVGDSTKLGYPGRLNQLFPQTRVVKLGVPGESTPTGKGRAAQKFATYADADFIIMLEGVNDYWLNDASTSKTRDNLLYIKQRALNTGAISLLANLTQVKRSFQKGWVSGVNSKISSNKEVDFYSLGSGIISGDLLHPNGNGYQAMANYLAGLLIQASAVNRPVDNDFDGIYDFAESKFGTSPFVTDSDGDGLADGAEVFIHHSSPLLLDSDNDGFNDGFEVNTLNSNPIDPRPSAPKMQIIELLHP